MKNAIGSLCAAAAVAATLSGAPAAHAATDCGFAIKRDLVVDLRRLDGEIRYDNTRSRRDLARLQKRSGRASAFGSAWTPVGLTQTELKYQMRVKVEAMPVAGNRYCARLTAVEADLGYERLDVFIARKFRPGSCAYSSIVEHERTHVAVFRQALDRYFPQLQRRIEQAAYRLEPVLSPTPNDAAAYLQRRLRLAVDPMFHEMNRTIDRGNAALDTPERYRLEQSRCQDW